MNSAPALDFTNSIDALYLFNKSFTWYRPIPEPSELLYLKSKILSIISSGIPLPLSLKFKIKLFLSFFHSRLIFVDWAFLELENKLSSITVISNGLNFKICFKEFCPLISILIGLFWWINESAGM